MSFEQYLIPTNPTDWGFELGFKELTLGKNTKMYVPGQPVPPLPEGGLVVLGVGEDRGAEANAGCSAAPDEIRRYLYRLAIPALDVQLVDLGNISVGQMVEDTYYAVAQVVAAVVAKGGTLILLGGSQDLTFAAYKGYEMLNRIINITSIDSSFDLEENEAVTSRTWLQKIVMQTPNYLFFHANVGYQTYFVGQPYITLMDDLKFDAYRLGEVQGDMARAEALIRNADLVSMDIGAVRQSDAPANGSPSPHGFYGEEFCQMMRYAGSSDKTSCVGVFEVNPLFDNHGQTAHMVAQGIWYFIEGFMGRKRDNPLRNPENCKHYMVGLEDQGLEIDFYKSKLSDRWWMRVPCNKEDLREMYSSHLMLPCTYADYQQCMQGDIPALWWRYYQRLNS